VTFQPGDRVKAESESTQRAARYGIVRAVLHEDPGARYRIAWDDRHTTIYAPAAGAGACAALGISTTSPRHVRAPAVLAGALGWT